MMLLDFQIKSILCLHIIDADCSYLSPGLAQQLPKGSGSYCHSFVIIPPAPPAKISEVKLDVVIPLLHNHAMVSHCSLVEVQIPQQVHEVQSCLIFASIVYEPAMTKLLQLHESTMPFLTLGPLHGFFLPPRKSFLLTLLVLRVSA